MIEFVHEVAAAYAVSPDLTRVGLFTYSTGVHHKFHLKDHEEKSDLLAAINGLRDMETGGWTDTDLGLKYAREVMFTEENGGRDSLSHNQILVLLTDGESTDRNATRAQASLLKSALPHLHLFTLGVGTVNEEELRFVCTRPSDYYYFYADDFEDLLPHLEDILNGMCNIKPPVNLPEGGGPGVLPPGATLPPGAGGGEGTTTTTTKPGDGGEGGGTTTSTTGGGSAAAVIVGASAAAALLAAAAGGGAYYFFAGSSASAGVEAGLDFEAEGEGEDAAEDRETLVEVDRDASYWGDV
eukprot:GHVN01062303.1.p1 GENE.GHVN01062303.1~~GHVN01062303.1.p1  ORF type:complete len:345 (+),score=37.13 GHVN01062303.1:147-1037(+)